MAPGRLWAAWVLLGLNILIYLLTLVASLVLMYLTGEPMSYTYNMALFLMGWKENVLIAQGDYWRLMTPLFLHGGLLHIALNSLGIYIMGPQTERVYGTGRFLVIYFVSGLAGSVGSYIFNPSPSVGASGAIFGLIGSLAVFFYTSRHIFGEAGREQLQGMIALIVVNILFGLGSQASIDNFGHIGGLIGGVACGFALVPRYELDRRFWPPVVQRTMHPLGWLGVGAVVVVCVLLVWLVPPAM